MSTTSGAEPALSPIGKVAEALDVSERTLRYYEEIGLVAPTERVRGRGRRYTEADVSRLSRVREMKDVMGYSLEEIRSILDAEDRFDAIRAAVAKGRDRAEQVRLLEEAIASLAVQQARVRAKYDRLAAALARMEESAARYEEALDQLAQTAGTAS